jgi:hypothetical protein
MVLHILREHKLYAKLSMCMFYQKKIHYLGHIILVEGITVDLENKEAIRGWLVPINVTEVRLFMGLVGYYRRFIKSFSKFAIPITSLQKKVVKFEWNSKCEDNFQQLKDILKSVSVLNIVD